MKNRVGKCPVCKERHPIRLGHWIRVDASLPLKPTTSPQIVMASHRRSGNIEVLGDASCLGSAMVPLHDPQLEHMRAKRRAARFALVEPFRLHAMVAHDAFAEGRPFPADDIAVLVRVAVYEYTFHYPDAETIAAVRFVRAKSRSGILRTGDMYCSFCGLLGARGIKADSWGRMFASRLIATAAQSHHATRCALEHLAFARVPSPPNTRRLPAEYVVEEAEATA